MKELKPFSSGEMWIFCGCWPPTAVGYEGGKGQGDSGMELDSRNGLDVREGVIFVFGGRLDIV